jgi:hypothetical protein
LIDSNSKHLESSETVPLNCLIYYCRYVGRLSRFVTTNRKGGKKVGTHTAFLT